MQQKRNKNIILLVVTFMLLSVLSNACSSTQKNIQKEVTEYSSKDTIKAFIPLHPPVVIPHSWKEAK